MVQYDKIAPSVLDNLFRRLLRDDKVAYLRERDGIYGYIVNPVQNLSGYLLIALNKQTMLCCCDPERKQLVLFPSLKDINVPQFEISQLLVKKAFFKDDTFVGDVVGENTLGYFTKRYLPPYTDLSFLDEVDDEVIEPTPVVSSVTTEVAEDTLVVLPHEDMDDFDELPDFEQLESEDDVEIDMIDDGLIIEDEVIYDVDNNDPLQVFMSTSFEHMGDVADYAMMHLGFSKMYTTVCCNTILNSNDIPADSRIDALKQLIEKMVKEGVIH